MTWQAAAFTILALGLAVGFAWYERTRPDARIVALVATLAAFAALGRIAFAALPNVKPTSDIVLVSGYALGAAPGFVIGALAGLTSNFFFGQGPWTPWQMAAWGATGMLGAGLAIITARRIGRWPLAIVCAISGFAFTAFQDFGDWITYSDHSLAQLGVYLGKGLAFDGIYAVSCLLFALAFGPALARAIERFATRLQVTWRPAIPVLVAVAMAAGLPGGQARAGVTGTAYLRAAQNSDGGFGPAPGQPSQQLYSGWAALGLASVHVNPADVSRDGHSVIDYLRAGVRSDTDPGSIERTILAVRAAGLPVTDFGGRDLLAALKREIGRDGSVSDQTNLTTFAVLALRAAGVAPSARTLSWLINQADGDGGFNYGVAGGSSDVDDTGAVLEALAEVPGSAAERARRRAVGFIQRQQDSDGGFPGGSGEGSNAQSTAWAVQGLLAVGTDGEPVERAVAYLKSLIAPDGHVRYSRPADQAPVWVTGEALMALAGKPLPLIAPPARPEAGHHPAPPAHPRPVRPARVRHPEARRAVSPVIVPAVVSLRLASDAGILDALALAPIGVG
ncbi:MAG TPA: prenyltransferase/squalene oxidase repeat-containing protein [Solirubrobacteraceae bacterium]|nr:prenyltransferase/squalene oxidase repeat-containing protein [Solirubrobacteraceae bacterium]